MSVLRCYSQKKTGFDVEAQGLLGALRDQLGIRGLESVVILNRYDADQIDPAIYEQAKGIVFSEPQVDAVYDETFPVPEYPHRILAVEALPGQFDQRADSAAQCIQLMAGVDRPLIAYAKVYLLGGRLTEEELDKIRRYLINPVESREASMDKPATLVRTHEAPDHVAVIQGFTTLDEPGLAGLLSQLGLAMDLDDLKFLQAYFRDEEKRDPTITEVRVVDTYWSDHCRHTTFSTHIDRVEILDPAVDSAYRRYLTARAEVYGPEKAAARPQTLMDLATIGAKVLKKRGLLQNLDQSEEINACSIHVTATVDGEAQDWLLMFKNETHNHPTEIEPFGGAATCIGGCIRDPLSGRAYVYQALRLTGCGDPRAPYDRTMEGKLPQRKLATTAAAGYSSYGNQIGLATGHVAEVYHDGYVAKHLEVGAVVGAAPASNVVRERPAPGDVVVLLGGRTGRDGIGGATGSSKSHNKASLTTMASEVQKGNAPEERKIQRLFRDSQVTRMIKRCNDFGAGGVSVAIGELAAGLRIDLDAVRKKYDGLDGTELAISESQERMAVVVAPEDADRFIAAAQAENLEAYPVAVVTESPRMVMTWKGQTIADLSRAFLDTNGADKHTSVTVPDRSWRLTATGRKQADCIGRWLVSQQQLFDRYMVSPYVRTRETAATMALPKAKWEENRVLRERSWREINTITKDEFKNNYARNWNFKNTDPLYWRPPAGESIADVAEDRVHNILTSLSRKSDSESVVMVTHGDFMLALMLTIEDLADEEFLHRADSDDWKITNCTCLHYTRRDPETGRTSKRVRWEQTARPVLDETTGRWEVKVEPWREFKRPYLSNGDLVDVVQAVDPHLLEYYGK